MRVPHCATAVWGPAYPHTPAAAQPAPPVCPAQHPTGTPALYPDPQQGRDEESTDLVGVDAEHLGVIHASVSPGEVGMEG